MLVVDARAASRTSLTVTLNALTTAIVASKCLSSNGRRDRDYAQLHAFNIHVFKCSKLILPQQNICTTNLLTQ